MEPFSFTVNVSAIDRKSSENDAYDSGALDGDRKHLLMRKTCASYATRKDATFFRLELAEHCTIFEVNIVDLVFAKTADFRLRNASLHTTLSVLHCHFSVLLNIVFICCSI